MFYRTFSRQVGNTIYIRDKNMGAVREIRLLHVDDDQAFTDMTGEFLERAETPIDLVQTTDPVEGRAIVADHDIDCVVSDYDMPGMSGIALLESIRETLDDLPFILFTGKGSEEIASEAIAAGATEYLQKGVGSEQYELLLNRIENAVERFRSDRERLRNERRFRTVFEDPHRLVHLLDEDGCILRCNQTSMDWIDQDESTVRGMAFWRSPWWLGQDRSVVNEWIEDGLAGTYVDFDYEGHTPSGEQVILDGSVRPVCDEADHVASLIVSWQDVTDEHRQQVQLAEQSRALEAVLDTVDAGIVMKDVESRYQILNEQWRSRLGIPEDSTLDALTDFELFAAPLAERFRAEDRQVMQSGEPIEVQHRVPTVDGKRTMLTRKTPVYSDGGTIKGVCAVSTDITDRVEQEEELTASQRRLEQQNERLEEFAEIVSHDLRNPLTTALGRVDVVETKHRDEHLDSARDAIQRAIQLIDDTLALAKQGRSIEAREAVSVSAIAEKAWDSVYAPEATLVCEDDVRITADPDRLLRLFENVFGNALHHGGDDVTITSSRSGDNSFSITDDGAGISASERQVILERGYTTTTEGTGYGLAIVQRIAQAHGWEIAVGESPEGGAAFDINGITFCGDDSDRKGATTCGSYDQESSGE